MDAHSGPNAGIDPLGKPVIPAFRCASWRATGCNKLPEISTAGWLVALSKPAHPRIALRCLTGYGLQQIARNVAGRMAGLA